MLKNQKNKKIEYIQLHIQLLEKKQTIETSKPLN